MVFGLGYAWPLARRWLAEADGWAAAAAAFGFSLGALSLWLFGLALVPGALSFGSALALPVAVFAAGLWAWNKEQGARSKAQGPRREAKDASLKSQDSSSQSQGISPSAIAQPASRKNGYVLRFTYFVFLNILFVLAVITLNVLYYPFYYADTLARYALFARRIFETGGLPASVQGYPLLVSLGYAWAFLAAGGVNDRLAGLISATFALGTVAVTYALGREMYGRRAGLIAAFLAVTCGLFVVWATSGYVDVPTGFYFALSALFAYRWLERGTAGEAWLGGLAAALAIWTKQAGLAILPALAAVVGLGVWQVARRHRALVALRGQRSALAFGRPLSAWDYLREPLIAGAIFAAAVVIVCGPWYLRNYLLSGWAGVVPLPGDFYTAQADRRLAVLLPFVTRPGEWGWPFALAGVAGLAWAGFEAIFGERAGRGEAGGGRLRPLFLLAFIAPYHLAWWWAFSYEARFLLTLLPFYAVLAARLLDWAAGRAGPSRLDARPARLALGGLALALAVWAVWPRLGAVYHFAQEPLASEHAIRLRLRPDQTLTVDYLRGQFDPAADSILLMDGSYEYFLTDYRTAVFYPVTLAEARAWDYVVVPGWAAELYASLGHDHSEFWLGLSDPALFREVYRAPVPAGSTIYQVLP